MCLSLLSCSLTACVTDGTSNSTFYPNEPAPGSMLYPEGYESNSNYNLPNVTREPESVPVPSPAPVQDVIVPESYHVTATAAPTRPKDVDRSWVSSQNPQGYTIELAEGDKAAQVAGVLYRAPKAERSAEVKSKRGYTGVYGSYPSYEAAQQTLNALPDDVKQRAAIKTWGSVQGELGN